MDPRKLIPHARRVVLLVACVSLIYLWTRFEMYGLPRDGCSPLSRFSPGDRLLLDRRGEPVRDQAVLVRGPDDVLYLGKVTRLRDGEAGLDVWIETDAPRCPGTDSDELGWIPEQDRVASVVLIWPW